MGGVAHFGRGPARALWAAALITTPEVAAGRDDPATPALARPTATATATDAGIEAPPLSPKELALVASLTRPTPAPPWPATELPFARRVPWSRLAEPLAPSVERATQSLPLLVLDDRTAVGVRDLYVGPHFIEPGLGGWRPTDPWRWGDLTLEDLGDERGAPAAQLHLQPAPPPAEDGIEVRAGAGFASADRGLRGLAGVGVRRGAWALRIDGNGAGYDDRRLPAGATAPEPRRDGGVAASAWWGGRPDDPGHLRLLARADLRGDAPLDDGRRVARTSVLVGVDGRWSWGDHGAVEAALNHQRAHDAGERWATQGRLRVSTPRLGPLFFAGHGLWSAGQSFEGAVARREAGGEVGVALGPAVVSAGPLLLNHAAGDDEQTTVGWAGRASVDLPSGWYLAAETRRGRDPFARRLAPTAAPRADGATRHVVVFGPGVRGPRGWARLQAVGAWADAPGDGGTLLPPPPGPPEWSARADGAVGLWRGLSLAGAAAVHPALAVHLSARYDADFGFLEVHGRGRTEAWTSEVQSSATTPGGLILGFMSGVELGAGFRLALAVDNITDAALDEAGIPRSGIDGRVLLSFHEPGGFGRVSAPP